MSRGHYDATSSFEITLRARNARPYTGTDRTLKRLKLFIRPRVPVEADRCERVIVQYCRVHITRRVMYVNRTFPGRESTARLIIITGPFTSSARPRETCSRDIFITCFADAAFKANPYTTRTTRSPVSVRFLHGDDLLSRGIGVRPRGNYAFCTAAIIAICGWDRAHAAVVRGRRRARDQTKGVCVYHRGRNVGAAITTTVIRRVSPHAARPARIGRAKSSRRATFSIRVFYLFNFFFWRWTTLADWRPDIQHIFLENINEYEQIVTDDGFVDKYALRFKKCMLCLIKM